MTEINDMIHLAIPDYVRPGKPACGIDSEVTIFQVREKIRTVNCQWCTIWWANNQTKYSTDIVNRVLDSASYDFHATHWVDSSENHPVCGVRNKHTSYIYVDEEELKGNVTCVFCRDILDGKNDVDVDVELERAAAFWDRMRQVIREEIVIPNEVREETPQQPKDFKLKFDNSSFFNGLLDAGMAIMDEYFGDDGEETEEADPPYTHYKAFGQTIAVCGWSRENDKRAGSDISWMMSQVTCPKCLERGRM